MKLFLATLLLAGTAGLAEPDTAAARTNGSIVPNGGSLNGMSMQGIEWNGVNMQGSEWNGINMQGIQMQGIEMQGIQTQGIQTQGIQTQGIQLNGVKPQGSQWNGTDLQGQRFNGITLQGIRPNGISWNSPILQGRNAVALELLNAQQPPARTTDWSAISLSRVTVRLPQDR